MALRRATRCAAFAAAPQARAAASANSAGCADTPSPAATTAASSSSAASSTSAKTGPSGIVGGATSGGSAAGSDLSLAIKGLRVSAFLGGPEPVAVGAVTAKISDNIFAVAFDRVPAAGRVIEVGSRVYVDEGDVAAGGLGAMQQQHQQHAPAAEPTGRAQQQQQLPPPPPPPPHHPPGPLGAWVGPQGGICARVNGDGTFAVLLDEGDRFLPAVARAQIALSEGKPKFLQADSYRRMVEWVRLSGVSRKAELESTSSILYARGWRENRMYLLEASDVHCLSHLNKSVRMGLLEKAEWEREHHRQRREWSKERLKETEWRYVVTKYSSVVSVFVAFCGAASVFMWNLVRWRREQRDYHLNVAAEKLSRRASHSSTTVDHQLQQDRIIHVQRQDKDAVVRRLRDLDPTHPRIVVLTGPRGCGKSTLCKMALQDAAMAAVYVDVRGGDDVPRAILKSLGVTAIEIVGDPMDFIEDACRLAQRNLRAQREPRSRVPSQLSAPEASPTSTRAQAAPPPEPVAGARGDGGGGGGGGSSAGVGALSSSAGGEPQQKQASEQSESPDALQSQLAASKAGLGAASSDASGDRVPSQQPASGTLPPPAEAAAGSAVSQGPAGSQREAFGSSSAAAAAAGGAAATSGSGRSRLRRRAPVVETTAAQELPCLVLKVRDTTSGVSKVYNEASVLACDRCVCNMIVEVDADKISQANLVSLPRLDIIYVPPFSRAEAAHYCQRLIDPCALEQFTQIIGTNSSDLDELISFVHHHDDDEHTITRFIAMRLSRSARRVRQLLATEPPLRAGLSHLAAHDFEEGAHATNSGPLLDLLTRIQADNVPSVLREMLFYDAARDVIVFSSKAFHTAAQILLT